LHPLNDFSSSVQNFIEYLKETPRAEGFDEILYPGELEARTRLERLRDGIDIDDATWGALEALKADVGV
jgi:LDH2 family malate/lactate/ureidoglycolate dehydrogenase